MKFMPLIDALRLPEFRAETHWIVFPQRGGLLLDCQALRYDQRLKDAIWADGVEGGHFDCDLPKLERNCVVVPSSFFNDKSRYLHIPWAEWD